MQNVPCLVGPGPGDRVLQDGLLQFGVWSQRFPRSLCRLFGDLARVVFPPIVKAGERVRFRYQLLLAAVACKTLFGRIMDG